MVLPQPSKLMTGVRFSSLAPKMSRSSRGLGHRPFTAGTGVRTPYGTPIIFKKCENITKKGLTFLLDLL